MRATSISSTFRSGASSGSHRTGDGEPRYRVRVREGALVTNAAFGGADGRTLYLTESESGTVLTVRLPEPGLRLFSHA